MMDAKIAKLLELRLRVAAQNRELAGRELSARELRLGLEVSLSRGNKAEAEKFAKAHPDYLEHERQSAQLTYLRDEALAHAECLRLEIRAAIAALEATGGAA